GQFFLCQASSSSVRSQDLTERGNGSCCHRQRTSLEFLSCTDADMDDRVFALYHTHPSEEDKCVGKCVHNFVVIRGEIGHTTDKAAPDTGRKERRKAFPLLAHAPDDMHHYFTRRRKINVSRREQTGRQALDQCLSGG